jgi:transposase, IS5 family
MLRTRNDQPTLWDAIIPPELLELPELLAKVDRLLDDERFFTPFEAHFHATEGRPSIPMETYLRLMFLKYRYGLGYETLVAEVADSLTWRRFCRIPLGARVPHATTLMKITTRCGAEAVEQLNDVLLAQAAEAKLVRMHKVRVDTTVVEADVAYPTDSGLLAKAITRLNATVTKVKAAGGAQRTRTRDRSRSAGKRARSIAANLKRRTGEAKDQVKRITGELADLAGLAADEAQRVISNAKRALRRQGAAASGRLARAVDDLETLVGRTTRIIAQTRTRLAGDTPPGSSRLVSLHDPDARPIVKGRLGKPVEFGYKAQIADNADGLVLDCDVQVGNPPDAELLVPAIERIARRVGKVPRKVTADRGYGEAGIDDKLTELGVTTVAIPRKAKPSAARREIERQPSFRRLVKWRTGAEGRISALKRGYGMDRSRIDGINGARTWVGHSILTHNLVHLAAMT